MEEEEEDDDDDGVGRRLGVSEGAGRGGRERRGGGGAHVGGGGIELDGRGGRGRGGRAGDEPVHGLEYFFQFRERRVAVEVEGRDILMQLEEGVVRRSWNYVVSAVSALHGLANTVNMKPQRWPSTLSTGTVKKSDEMRFPTTTDFSGIMKASQVGRATEMSGICCPESTFPAQKICLMCVMYGKKTNSPAKSQPPLTTMSTMVKK